MLIYYLTLRFLSLIERLYNLSTIYEVAAIMITIVAFFYYQLAWFAFIFNLMGVLILLWEFYGHSIAMKFTVCYDDFKAGFRKDLWEPRLPPYTMKMDPKAAELNLRLNPNHQDVGVLDICTLKRNVGLVGPLAWEGGEVVAKKNGYNLIMAKLTLKFEESTAEEGNIYLVGRGRLGRFHYLIGIDKSSRDVFFHIWDKEEKARYGPPEVGSYIKERGRTHLKDYLEGWGEKWLILGIEWSLEGPKFFAYKEGEKNIVKIPVNTPPELREEILKDSKAIYLYGLTEFAIRTDLMTKDPYIKKSIKGAVDYVRVKTAPLYWMVVIQRLVSVKASLLRRPFQRRKQQQSSNIPMIPPSEEPLLVH
jgi:hypothetical protein